jgi:large subunit ribosomal protein L9
MVTKDIMKVFLLKNVEKIGMEGEIIKVSDGFAMNYLIPQKLGIEVTAHNEAQFKARERRLEKRAAVIESQTSMMAEKIKSLSLMLRRKMHDNGKLYGAVSNTEIADLLAQKGISIAKNKIEIPKSIKAEGTYEVTVRLSSRLQPKFTLKIVPE